ncbi:hypothetical protein FE772_03105 [Lysobacter enzymogenes]|nr:hypothetical protein [Lysobacter enzymogenes]QCW24810.1 hypothetical protein FE772_03105 [Lysobacter enzymogenes]
MIREGNEPRRLSTEEYRMKGWIGKGAASAFFVGLMIAAAPAAAEPTYECTASAEGHMFLVPYDHPRDPGYYYQCRGGAWRLIAVCSQSAGCPPAPDPGGPIVEI